MIKKMRRRYLILNMILLSGTLLLSLAILFGILYHSEVSSSYTVMREMMNEQNLPPKMQESTHGQKPKNGSESSSHPEISPQNYTADAELLLLDNEVYPPFQPGGWNGNYFGGPPYWGYQFPNPYGWNYQNPFQPWWQPDNGNQNGDNHQGDNPPPATGSTAPGTAATSQKQSSQTTAKPLNPEKEHEQPPHSDSHRDPPGEEPRHSERASDTQPTQDTRATQSMTSAEQTVQSTTTRTTASTVKTTKTQTQSTAQSAATTTTKLVPVEEGHYVPDAYIAEFDDEGNISAYAGNEKDSTEDESFRKVHHAADKIKEKGVPKGTLDIGDESYRFLYEPDHSGNYRLVLLDRTAEKATISKMIFIFLLIAAVGLICMFGISMLLANWTVTPVETAWEKQKQFVADASHELKTPLAVISANTEVIMANSVEKVVEHSKWLYYIQSETKRMSKLISGLLSVARLDHKSNQKEEIKPIQLSETVSNICLVFEPIIYEKNKTLNTVLQRNVYLKADEDNVKQLLSILLDNAVLHSVPNAQITVSLSKDVQNKIRLSVSNTAQDIPKHKIEHIFDRFYRLDTEGSPNGSGLGLSIAKSIIHQLGGTISVSSENQLVTFVVLFHP